MSTIRMVVIGIVVTLLGWGTVHAAAGTGVPGAATIAACKGHACPQAQDGQVLKVAHSVLAAGIPAVVASAPASVQTDAAEVGVAPRTPASAGDPNGNSLPSSVIALLVALVGIVALSRRRMV